MDIGTIHSASNTLSETRAMLKKSIIVRREYHINHKKNAEGSKSDASVRTELLATFHLLFSDSLTQDGSDKIFSVTIFCQ